MMVKSRFIKNSSNKNLLNDANINQIFDLMNKKRNFHFTNEYFI